MELYREDFAMTSVWVLTSEYNDQGQYGQYFEAVFLQKPTGERLLDLGVDKEDLDHVLAGGGRRGDDYVWWYLTEHKL
jgi:hypothetical protein